MKKRWIYDTGLEDAETPEIQKELHMCSMDKTL